MWRGLIRASLEGLRDRLREALDAMTDPVVLTHENTKATVEQLAREQSWDRSPVGRGGFRT